MDYRYIEQLLERYWDAETTPSEENILKAFFRQADVPQELKPYQALFEYEDMAKTQRLDENFDKKVLALVEDRPQPSREQALKAREITWFHRLRPLYRAVASVAIVLLLGTAAQSAFQARQDAEVWDYNFDSYADTYQKPEEALNASIDGLQEIKQMLLEENDSLFLDAAEFLNDNE